MAKDQTEKRRALGRALAVKSAALLDVIYGLEELRSQYTSAGLTFEDADFTAAGLQHMEPAVAANVLGSIDAIGKYVRGDGTAPVGSHITNFEQARP